MLPKTINKQRDLFYSKSTAMDHCVYINKNRLTFETMCFHKFQIFNQGFVTVLRTGKI